MNHSTSITTNTNKQNQSQAEDFLKAIFRQQARSFLEIRAFPSNKDKPIQKFFSIPSELGKAAAFAVGVREQVYYSAAPRSQQKGTADAVNTMPDLWVDGDEGALSWTSLSLTSTMSINTGNIAGNHYHAYYLLNPPLELKTQSDRNQAVAYLRALCTVLKGDPKSCDIARILRVPGTYNTKDPDHPGLCQIIELNPEARYSLEEIRDAITLSLVIRYWERGQRQDIALSLAGYLAKCEVPEGKVRALLEKLLALTGDEEPRARLGALEASYKKLREGKKVKGYRGLAQYLDKNELQALDSLWQPHRGEALPEVIVNNRQLRDITGEALEILEKANHPEFLFVRAGGLTRITWNEEGYPVIELVSESALRGYMTRTANFVKVHENQKGEITAVAAPPPLDVVRDILSLGQWPLPPLQGIIQAPAIRQDGSLITRPGYDAPTKLYYMPTSELSIPEIPDNPTHEDALRAAALLMEVISDFPFDSQASKANALAAVITPILRPLVAGKVPMALFDKPQPGTGASLLAEVVDTIATGRSSAISPLKDDEAWRKEIASILLRGQRTVIIDNIERKLYAPSLGSLLTSDYWEFRILGHNQEVALPHRCVWIATGNNIQVGGDLPRRCYWVRLDAKQARPWERDRSKFKHPELIKWVQKKRGRIVAAILTIGRAWFIAGQPLGQKNLGGYEEWASIIGGILGYVGVSGFLDNLSLMYDITDVDTPQWEDFLARWYTTLGAVPVTVAEVVRALDDYDDFAKRLPDDLVDYYKDKSGQQAKGFTRRLGKALAKRNGVRYPKGYVLEKCGEKERAICWKVDNLNVAKNEFNEFNEFPLSPHTENSKSENNIYKEETNSQNSLNSSTPSQPAGAALDSPPVYPTQPCPTCGCGDYWLTDDNRWLCSRCHPKPREIDMEV